MVFFLALRFEDHEYARLSDDQLAEAAAYLDGKLTPAPPGWQWGVFMPEPGVQLRTGMVDAANAKGTVVVVPGFTAPIEMLMREIVKINAGGYRVASIEYRGQGESYRPLANPEKGFVESYGQLGAELAQYAETVRIAGKPLFFYAISKGLVFGRPAPCNANPETAQVREALFANRETLRTNGVTMGWFYETAASTERLFDPAHTAAIVQPIKMFTAGVDALVDTSAAQQFCDSLAQCEIEHLSGSRHCVTREDFELYDRMIEDVIRHYDQQSQVISHSSQ
jgi:alpha-beta hydrolase superfamily lysophospholipase